MNTHLPSGVLAFFIAIAIASIIIFLIREIKKRNQLPKEVEIKLTVSDIIYGQFCNPNKCQIARALTRLETFSKYGYIDLQVGLSIVTVYRYSKNIQYEIVGMYDEKDCDEDLKQADKLSKKYLGKDFSIKSTTSRMQNFLDQEIRTIKLIKQVQTLDHNWI